MVEKRVLIVGATGMVGGCVLRTCLESRSVSMVTSVGRRKTGVEDGRLHEVLHDDFMDCGAIAEELRGHDLALYCLGAYTGAVPDDEFRLITVDYTLAFATALYQVSPQTAFCFLSGQGADRTEQSRMAFARYKGAAENGLLAVGFPRVHIFRPGYIYPVTPRQEPNRVYRITRSLYPALKIVYPNIGISSEDLARAMVHVGLDGYNGHESPILKNRDIRLCIKSSSRP